jgi:acyl-CoA synthetase (AMP-forming)/AMP-acid ligase II
VTISPHPSGAPLCAVLDAAAERHGSRCAVVDGDIRLSFADLAREARRVAAGLRALGVSRGDTLAVWLPNCYEWLVFEYACARLDVLLVALNPRHREAELAHLLGVARPRALALAPGFLGIDFAGMAREAAPDLPLIAVRGAGEALVSYDGLRAHGELRTGGTAGALRNAFPTSGTTASPKVAAHDDAGVARHAVHVAAALDLAAGDAMLMSLPLCGVFGFTGALAALCVGATVVLQRVFEPDEAARLLIAERATHFYGPDGMVAAVLSSPVLDGRAARRWRWGGYANFTTGRPLALIEQAEATAGVRLVGLYGSSECFALMCAWRPEDPAPRRAQAGGRPVSAEIQVRAGDPDTGAPRGAGERGELQVRGYNVMRAYLANEPATRAAFTADGWFRTGDLGRVDADGACVFLTRLKDSLRVRGHLLDPAEVEEFLLRHPRVAAAQVVGVRAEGEGDIPVAFVQPAPGAVVDEDDLLAYCRQRIAAYKVPRRICALAAFPTVTGPNGTKVQRHRLREMAEALLGRA